MLSPRPLLALLLASALAAVAAPNIRRDGWSFDRSDLIVYPDTDLEKKRAEGTFSGIGGSVDYDIQVDAPGWYELWIKGAVPNAARDVYLDGEVVLWLTTSQAEDAGEKGWLKECNLYLSPGQHTLRLKRWMYSPVLPSQWELRPSGGSAAGSVRVVDPGMKDARRPQNSNAVRVGDPIKVVLEGGRPGVATTYALVARDQAGALTELGSVDFPASERPVRREFTFSLPRQGIFFVLGREGGKLLRPADLKVGEFVAVDMRPPAVAETELRVRNVLDIDCTAAPPSGRFWEKDGASTVVDRPAGRYRESSGQGSVAEWGADGFSYKFDLPETEALYRIRVDYPDDERRSMGFWVTDNLGGQTNFTGVVNTGGVETGDHYRLSGKMLTHEAYFRPRAQKDLIVAVLNCVPGLKAAAARIRIDLVESGLPPAPAGERGGRALGYYFEEPGRWLRFFAGNDRSPPEQLKTLERYGQLQRHLGSNLMFATVQVYGGTHYPSRVLDGYMNTTLNETRLAALVAEKYGCQFIPELFLTGQMPFDSRTMGVRSYPDGKVEFHKPESERIVLRDRDGKLKCFWKPFAYNPLHPTVQNFYIEAIGELADMLADTGSFAGISSRMMIGWQNQSWNCLPNLDWGYEDWTMAEFSRDTGVKIPGAADDPARFRQRFEFLTGAAMREKWMDWRSARIFAFHQKLRDRIKQAKPDANLFFTYFPRDTPVEYSPDMLGKMREQAIDFARYENEPGMQLVPGMTYGRRFSTPLADAENTEPLFDEQLKAIARSGMRAAGVFGLYFELNKNLDWTGLGAKSGLAAFDASVPAGRAELEGYALALADSDSSLIITGGNGWMFGTASLMQPFLREYRALPAKPFTRFEKAVDPVAVWRHRDADGVLWFYAVNRLPVPTTLELTFGGTPKVRPAAGGAELALDAGRLEVALEPFELKTYRAQSGELRDARVSTPPDYVASLRARIADAVRLREDILARRLAPEASLADATEAAGRIDAASAAFANGEYWFASGQLERLAPTRLSYASGRYVPGVMARSVPHGVPNFSDKAPKGLRVEWRQTPGNIDGASDLSFDSAGRLWVASPAGLAEFDATGKWRRTLSLFAPYAFENGDVRKSVLFPPGAYAAETVRPLSADRLLVQRGGDAPMVLDVSSGRFAPLSLGNAYFIQSRNLRLLASRPDGTALMQISDKGPSAGLSVYGPDGTFLRRLNLASASAAAWDATGRLYLATRDAILVLDEQGRESARLAESGAHRLAFSPDGGRLFVLTSEGAALATWQRGSDGRFARQGETPLVSRASSLTVSPGGAVLLGFRKPADGVVVREYSVRDGALKAFRDLVTVSAAALQEPAIDESTQLKAHAGNLYFLSGGKLARFVSGSGAGASSVKIVFDPKFAGGSADAFAFSPEGDLYLASQRQGSMAGLNLYRCRKSGDTWGAPEYLNGGKPLIAASRVATDLGVDGKGRVVFLAKSPKPPARLRGEAIALFRWDPRGNGEPEFICELGAPQVTQGEGGLHLLPDGGWLVAGGNARTITRLAADDKIVWRIRREKSLSPGSPDLRCPLGITADGRGDVWVSDPTRHQLLQLDGRDGRLVRALGSFGDGSDASRLAFNRPAGVTVAPGGADGEGRIIVLDTGNRRLVSWPLAR